MSIIESNIIQRNNRIGEKWRPQFHFSAPSAWMNDPNGPIYFKGWYHLFYQYNPKHCNWDAMHWGHAVSKDIIHWKDLPIALYPDQHYDKHSEGGCFSGSTVEKDEVLYLFYSSTIKEGNKLYQSQSLVLSDDGITFNKYAKNPIIAIAPEGASEDFRDPKVFYSNGKWRMVVGGSVGGADKEYGDGRIFLYSSDDLFEWEFNGSILDSEGKLGTMFECPDMFELNGKWVLTCSPMNHPKFIKSMYCVGTMDFETCSYTIDKIGNMDVGFDFYAPQSFLDMDGNRVLIGWQNGWTWMPWCEDWGPTEIENWRGVLSIPRVAELAIDNTLCLRPVKEFEKIIQKVVEYTDFELSKERKQLHLENQYCFQIELFLFEKKIESRCVRIGIRGKGDRVTIINIDLIGDIITLDKSHADEYKKGMIHCPVKLNNGKLNIRIVCDNSIIEIYINDGYYNITNNFYPEEDQVECWIETPYKKAVLDKLVISTIETIWE